MQEKEYINEDEIDLRELFLTIWKYKFFVIGFTIIITIISVIYVYLRTPFYEATATVQMGSYKATNGSNHDLDNSNELVEKLNVIFDKTLIEEPKSYIDSNKVLKSKSLIRIKSLGISNELAIEKIKEVLSYIQSKHQEILNEIKIKRELSIKSINSEINAIKDVANKLLKNLIKSKINKLNNLKEEMFSLNKNIKRIEKSNPTLTALKLIEKRTIIEEIDNINDSIYSLKKQYEENVNKKINKLKEEKEKYKSLLLPHNYKNTQVIGTIITNKFPVKPKKKLIVIVSFFTSFILAIFLVFFIEFIKGFKKEEDF